MHVGEFQEMNQTQTIATLGYLHPIVGQECKPRYVLTGHGTYRARFTLASLGWTWSEKHVAWWFDTSDASDHALKFARSLRNVKMAKMYTVVRQAALGI